MPRARKTGTTIAGIVFKDGVVLGADTRATEGDTVADKNCSKIHYLQPNMYCCGAGEGEWNNPFIVIDIIICVILSDS